MSNVIELPICRDAIARREAGYLSEWSRYYSASRALVDRQTAINLADSHVAYLKNRDAEILRGDC